MILIFKNFSLFSFLIFLTLSFNLLPCSTEELFNETTILTKHRFSIFFDQTNSKLQYELSSTELINGIRETPTPDITIKGKLILESLNSVSLCRVRLQKDVIEASNEANEKISIRLKGNIGRNQLSSQFINPDFGDSNVINFVINGYVDPTSLKNFLKPGQYNYTDQVKLIVDFEKPEL